MVDAGLTVIQDSIGSATPENTGELIKFSHANYNNTQHKSTATQLYTPLPKKWHWQVWTTSWTLVWLWDGLEWSRNSNRRPNSNIVPIEKKNQHPKAPGILRLYTGQYQHRAN